MRREQEFIYISEVIYLKCKTDKYANFIKDKVYEAKAHFRCSNGWYTGFKVTDEDGDYYTITKQSIIKMFYLVEGDK